MRIAIYPGTFDPVTNGHLDILQRAAKLFDEIVIAVAEKTSKNTLFTWQERIELIRGVTASIPDVKVEGFSGLTMEYVKTKGACAVVRGLRAISDFEYEFQLSMMNKRLYDLAETIFLTTDSNYSFISSSMIKEVAALGGCIKGLVPLEAEAALKRKLGCRPPERKLCIS